jgi:hypothetical protein
MVDDELQTPKMNSFVKGEANTGLVLAIGDDSEFW